MSQAARLALVNHPSLLLRTELQRQDLLDEDETQTELIAHLLYMVDKGHIMEITALNRDHSDDQCLGRHSHRNGFAADGWFNASKTLGDYLDAQDSRFIAGLEDAAKSPWLWQIGLAGSANNPAAWTAAGPTVYADDGADHWHFGANG